MRKTFAAAMVLIAATLPTSGVGFRYQAHSTDSRPANAGYKVVGYYLEWDSQCAGCIPLSHENFGQLTTLNYAFATPVNDTCKLGQPSVDEKTDFPTILAAKHQYPNLQVLLSLGGAGAQFKNAVDTPAKIQTLVKNCQAFFAKYPGVFDGIDIDWEYPSNSTQKAEFTALVQAFRTALGPTAPITAAVVAYFSIDWKTVASSLSWFNLMAYDLHGPWDNRTDFVAPLKADPKDPLYDPTNSVTRFASTMVNTYGIPASKVVLGIPFYGYGYAHVPAKNHGLYQKYKGLYRPKSAGGTVMYWQVVNKLAGKDGFKQYGPDPYSLESYLYKPGSNGGVFISFDDPSTIAAKMQLVKTRSLGGAMIWDIAFDTTSPKTSLLAAINQGLQ